MSHVNIVKKIKVDGDWKLHSIPRNAKGNYDWNALPEGLYLIEWRAGGKRRRESAGVTAAQALEAQRRKRHELEGRKLGVPGFETAGETGKKPALHVAVNKYLEQIEALKKPNTHRKYEAVLKRFLDYFRDRDSIDAISADDLTGFVVSLKKDHSLGSNTILHSVLRCGTCLVRYVSAQRFPGTGSDVHELERRKFRVAHSSRDRKTEPRILPEAVGRS